MKRFRLPLALGFAALLAAAPAAAQSADVRATVANLREDVRLLTEEVRSLGLAVKTLRRENEELRQRVENRGGERLEQRIASLRSTLNDRLESLRSEFRQADSRLKREFAKEVERQMDLFAKETQQAIDAVAQAVNASPQIDRDVSFSEDYPETGVSYTVRSGDTLSKIAREHGSTVKDIQNANKIADPGKLQAGQTIFVPVEPKE